MTQGNKISIKITQASLNQTALDWPRNMSNHREAINIAGGEGSNMVLMPELSLTGYECGDEFQRVDQHRIHDATLEILNHAKAKSPCLFVSFGTPWRLPRKLRDAFENSDSHNPDLVKNPIYNVYNRPFNVQVLGHNGKIDAITAKANLYVETRGYENRHFNEWGFNYAEEYARLANIKCTYGTVPIDITTKGCVVPFGRPLVYIADGHGHAYVHATAICHEKWFMTRFEGFPDNSLYHRFNIIPSISNYLGTKDGLLLEISNASPPAYLKADKHMELNDMASNYVDAVVDTDGLGVSGSTFAQNGFRYISQNGETISAGARMEFKDVAATTSVVTINNATPGIKDLCHVSLVL